MVKLDVVYKLYNAKENKYYAKGGKWTAKGHIFKRKSDLKQALKYFKYEELVGLTVEHYLLSPKCSLSVGLYR